MESIKPFFNVLNPDDRNRPVSERLHESMNNASQVPKMKLGPGGAFPARKVKAARLLHRTIRPVMVHEKIDGVRDGHLERLQLAQSRDDFQSGPRIDVQRFNADVLNFDQNRRFFCLCFRSCLKKSPFDGLIRAPNANLKFQRRTAAVVVGENGNMIRGHNVLLGHNRRRCNRCSMFG
jgi:hypothetical protein